MVLGISRNYRNIKGIEVIIGITFVVKSLVNSHHILLSASQSHNCNTNSGLKIMSKHNQACAGKHKMYVLFITSSLLPALCVDKMPGQFYQLCQPLLAVQYNVPCLVYGMMMKPS